VLETTARVASPAKESHALYRPLPAIDAKSVSLRLIPYYAWSNRGPSEMSVWLPVR
jgi:DUF1680 family protein